MQNLLVELKFDYREKLSVGCISRLLQQCVCVGGFWVQVFVAYLSRSVIKYFFWVD